MQTSVQHLLVQSKKRYLKVLGVSGVDPSFVTMNVQVGVPDPVSPPQGLDDPVFPCKPQVPLVTFSVTPLTNTAPVYAVAADQKD